MTARIVLFLLLPVCFFACDSSSSTGNNNLENILQDTPEHVSYQKIGSIERLDAELDQLLDTTARLEILAEGFGWSEGPVWIPQDNYLLFSDVVNNKIYKWKEGDSTTLYLDPSGFTGTSSESKEPGSNGLTLDRNGKLVLCQHGNRCIARMEAPLTQPKAIYDTIVDAYEGKRFNSPNDLIYMSNGDLYFTDPPYGLPGGMDSPDKELDFQGVYRFDAGDSTLHLLTKKLSRPNGIAVSASGETLYVANSDSENAVWMAYDIKKNGDIENGRVFYNATHEAKTAKGLPDGLKIHSKGYLFATGPGGIWILTTAGKHIGTIKTEVPAANCAFNSNETALYITASNYLLRLNLKMDKL